MQGLLAPLVALLGGLGLFLIGMDRLTEGLKVAAGPALKELLARWTSTRLRGLLTGILITALVQSSSAVTVATIGFVNAGLLSLSQAVWLVFGTNIGSTMTAWLVALVGVKLDMAALALPLIGAGVAVALGLRGRPRLAGLGEAISGFGLFFLGLGVLAGGFAGLASQLPPLAGEGPAALLGAVGLGFALTLLTQSSSAAIAIALTAAASGALGPLPAAATVIGTNIGTTSTAGFASLGATAAARRVVAAHVLFNLITGAAALLLLRPMFTLASTLAADAGLAASLAVFHTLFNLLGVLLMWPIAARLLGWLQTRFATGSAAPRHLDRNLLAVPSLALAGLVQELDLLAARSFAAARAAIAGDPGPARSLAPDIEALGTEVREFIGKLAGAHLPEADSGALADLMRATHHIEDLAALALQIGPATTPAPPAPLAAEVAAALAPPQAQAPGSPPQDPEAGLAAIATAWAQAKQALLASTAIGDMAPAALDAALARLLLLRRAAEAALKARRRLAPWLEAAQPASR